MNFSLQYPYNFKQTSDENKEKYQLGDYQLIQLQILRTKIIRIVQQSVRRITNKILGLKGLTQDDHHRSNTAASQCNTVSWKYV